MKHYITLTAVLLTSGCCVGLDLDSGQSEIATLVGTVTPEDEQLVNYAVTETTYYVTGATTDMLDAEMRRIGPKDTNGDSMFGLTQWYFNPEWSRKGCNLERIRTDINIIMPIYKGPKTSALASFNKLRAAMEIHEHRHAQIVKRFGVQMAKEIRAKPRIGSCESYKEEAREIINRLDVESARANVEYDAITQHGAIEGVRWNRW